MATNQVKTRLSAMAHGIRRGVKYAAFRLVAWFLSSNGARMESGLDFIKQPVEPLRGRTERSKLSSCY